MKLLSFALLVAFPCAAQQAASARPAHPSAYLGAQYLDMAAIVGPPPQTGSAAFQQDAEAVRAAQRGRTTATVKAAQRDDGKEDMFLYATVLGPQFREENLPRTAALSAHVRGEAATVTPRLKDKWQRPRPFVVDDTIHPVCVKKTEPGYPSGHAMVGYLEGLTLSQMVPERAAEIMARARGYAANRVVCGVHYPSDIEASRSAALVAFGALSTSESFRAEMDAARVELRAALHLPLDRPR